MIKNESSEMKKKNKIGGMDVAEWIMNSPCAAGSIPFVRPAIKTFNQLF